MIRRVSWEHVKDLPSSNPFADYVFVDEHNRHRRLKGRQPIIFQISVSYANEITVVRACEGCRRRKIKCDSATTNQWPCAACNRLKLQCNPPAVSYERNGMDQNAKFGMQGVLEFDQSSLSGDEDYMIQPQNGYSTWDMHTPPNVHIPPASYPTGIGAFGTPPYSAPVHQQEFAIDDLSLPLDDTHASFDDPNSYSVPSKPSIPRSNSSTWSQDQYTVGDLSDMLGDLKINLNGVGELDCRNVIPYIY